jgi:hypothetical protein
MIRLGPTTITMAASEIREYENRVRFKNHLKKCQQLETAREPPRPTRYDEQVVDATTSDSDQASNSGIAFDHGSPDLSPAGQYESNANTIRRADTPPHSDGFDYLGEAAYTSHTARPTLTASRREGIVGETSAIACITETKVSTSAKTDPTTSILEDTKEHECMLALSGNCG